ncbi:TPA: hypothetical protein DEG21_02200 [Patescibacteria group bacterium]|nr:hypothetical protein [Candidatus Gracilibacteria bacterium]
MNHHFAKKIFSLVSLKSFICPNFSFISLFVIISTASQRESQIAHPTIIASNLSFRFNLFIIFKVKK